MSELDDVRTRGDLERVIVVVPRKADDPSYLESIFSNVGRALPKALTEWDRTVDAWCGAYRKQFGDCQLVEVNLRTAVFVFDRTYERVVVPYGIATPASGVRDQKRMRRFPDVNIGVRATMRTQAFVADRGHFLSHASGGELDMNLFPHRRELNRGWSSEGRLLRRMETYTAAHPGTFHFHRPEYDDLTWIPSRLEYGILREENDWWIEQFGNK